MFKFFSQNSNEKKEKDEIKENLSIITQMNHEFSISLDLTETLNNALEVIAKKINAEASSVFLINQKKLECIASTNQDSLESMEIPLTQGVVAKAMKLEKCIRVGDVRKDTREIKEFYFELDSKNSFQTISVLCAPLLVRSECIGIIQCVNKKNDNRLFEEEDRELLEILSMPAALAIKNAQMANEMIEKNKTQKEIEIVGEIQKSLLTQDSDLISHISGINIPAKIISGDFYNFSDLGNGLYGFGVADVSGKGIKSSLLMSKASSLYTYLSKNIFSPSQILNLLNKEICETISRGMFVTMLVGIYDTNKNELCLSNAGHEPPLIYSKDKNFESFIISDPPLGVIEEIEYKETTIEFKSSSIYIFTDGVTEIKDTRGEMLGSEGLQKYIQKHSLDPINHRLKAIVDDATQLEKNQKDDITMLVIDSI